MQIIPDRSADNSKALLEGDTTGKIIGAFYAIYNELGYGFLESVYAGALEIELTERGLPYVREHPSTCSIISELSGCSAPTFSLWVE